MLSMIKALVADHPQRAAAIIDYAESGMDASAIKAKIAEEDKDEELASLKARVSELEEENASLKSQLAEADKEDDEEEASAEEHEEEEKAAALAAELAAAKAALAEAQGFIESTPADPGATVSQSAQPRRSQMSDIERTKLLAKIGKEAYQAIPW